MEERGETMITILSATRVQRVAIPSTAEIGANCRGNGSGCKRTGGPFLKSRVAGERLAFASTDGISRASERKIFYLNRQGFGDACSR